MPYADPEKRKAYTPPPGGGAPGRWSMQPVQRTTAAGRQQML